MYSNLLSDNQSAPILLLVFNRPEKTRQIFEVIKEIKPSKLYIAADGPREERISDVELCRKTREIFLDISWNCSIKTLFREKNCGCKNAVSSAISWFFSHESEGIILEDDCLPNPVFFKFCTELLEKYRTDMRIMMISGDNFLNSKYKPEGSYYFSLQTHIWGWATWKRAWDYYDVELKKWPEFQRLNILQGLYPNKRHANGWTSLMNKIYSGEIETWDYQWQFTCWTHNGLSIMPSENLVTNIGDDSEGTHFDISNNFNSEIQHQEIKFPLIHPIFLTRDYQADNITLNRIFPYIGFIKRLVNTSKYVYNRLYTDIIRLNIKL